MSAICWYCIKRHIWRCFDTWKYLKYCVSNVKWQRKYLKIHESIRNILSANWVVQVYRHVLWILRAWKYLKYLQRQGKYPIIHENILKLLSIKRWYGLKRHIETWKYLKIPSLKHAMTREVSENTWKAYETYCLRIE